MDIKQLVIEIQDSTDVTIRSVLEQGYEPRIVISQGDNPIQFPLTDLSDIVNGLNKIRYIRETKNTRNTKLFFDI